jgi:hypothetical protein
MKGFHGSCPIKKCKKEQQFFYVILAGLLIKTDHLFFLLRVFILVIAGIPVFCICSFLDFNVLLSLTLKFLPCQRNNRDDNKA